MNAPAHAREAHLLRLRHLMVAYEVGDEAGYQSQLAQLAREHEAGLFTSVARLTRELHQAIFDSKLDGTLATLAHEQMPDACSRLDYVVQLTETAAHKTLDLVERSRQPLRDIQNATKLIGTVPQPASAQHAVATINSSVDELRNQLSQLAQAQEYQDLSGQLIKRVIGLVRGTEAALLELLRAAGPLQNPGAAPIATASAPVLQGPAVPGLHGAQVSQEDADALLSSLGF